MLAVATYLQIVPPPTTKHTMHCTYRLYDAAPHEKAWMSYPNAAKSM